MRHGSHDRGSVSSVDKTTSATTLLALTLNGDPVWNPNGYLNTSRHYRLGHWHLPRVAAVEAKRKATRALMAKWLSTLTASNLSIHSFHLARMKSAVATSYLTSKA